MAKYAASATLGAFLLSLLVTEIVGPPKTEKEKENAKALSPPKEKAKDVREPVRKDDVGEPCFGTRGSCCTPTKTLCCADSKVTDPNHCVCKAIDKTLGDASCGKKGKCNVAPEGSTFTGDRQNRLEAKLIETKVITTTVHVEKIPDLDICPAITVSEPEKDKH